MQAGVFTPQSPAQTFAYKTSLPVERTKREPGSRSGCCGGFLTSGIGHDRATEAAADVPGSINDNVTARTHPPWPRCNRRQRAVFSWRRVDCGVIGGGSAHNTREFHIPPSRHFPVMFGCVR
ncbi:unnamed protein product [Pleuronectes platessa]|uniref:Uncharacterized protein n=1 Tax=Pleuronectes platessa TaxID=8262 RepID=A0A9N7U5E2_PLEPL|nr:unnamed protein product [Pleuronectes platessa]